ncbi:hypothetical protein BX264_4466 [Streptomyces sp. 2333.5]|uniref:hypothetical protein n=1 Tax=unclassified Streptomyces TaxID=2593676 RepID=UPI000897CA03|nr:MULTISPECIES: hypothetical protein [unclassified Streptomyces]PJJ04063.1 hypothetical protein BX264_4466 [Streptomyces sp. 2333.5]SEE41194.1 hypothetical protein SAMN05428943_4638 [Streptomyces sp. 2314.4]SEE66916.1 hypothetical protein SAMN05428942_4567 [Streptomyces sp. 2112.2]
MSLYGRDDIEWDQLVRAGTNFLIERARLGKVTTYTELNFTLERRTGYRPFDFERPAERAAMGHLLGLIVVRDHESDPAAPRLMLSALVHYLGANDAGSGFYELARQVGLLSLKASKAAKEEFWIGQIKALYDRYGAPRP